MSYCIAQGTLLNGMWQPGWEGSLGENEYMCMYGWVPQLLTWNYHSIVNWLCAESISHVRLFGTPQSRAHQAPLAMGILQARILEWVAISFSRGSSWPRNWTQVSCIAGRFFTDWAMREAPPMTCIEERKKKISKEKMKYLNFTWNFQ